MTKLGIFETTLHGNHFEPSTKKVGPGTIKLHFFKSNRPFSPLFTPYLHLCSSQSKTEVSFALFGVGLTYFRHFWKKNFFVGLAAVTLVHSIVSDPDTSYPA